MFYVIAPGVYVAAELIDFGIVRTFDEPRTVPINLVNTGDTVVHISVSRLFVYLFLHAPAHYLNTSVSFISQNINCFSFHLFIKLIEYCKFDIFGHLLFSRLF